MKVTKDMTIGELLMADRGAGMILMQNGMHCVGCLTKILRGRLRYILSYK